MTLNLWFLEYVKDLQTTAFDALTKKLVDVYSYTFLSEEIRKKLLQTVDQSIEKEKRKFNHGIHSTLHDFCKVIDELVGSTSNNIKNTEFSLNLVYSFSLQDRAQIKSLDDRIFTNIIEELKSLFIKLESFSRSNIYLLATLKGCERINDLLSEFQIGGGIETEHYSTYLSPTNSEIDKLNDVLNEHSKNLMEFRYNFQRQKDPNEEKLKNASSKAYNITTSNSKKRKVDQDNLEEFVKHFVNQLSLDDKKRYGSWVSSLYSLTDTFYKMLFMESQNFPEDFSKFCLHYIINSRIFELWVFRKIAELYVPVVANVKYKNLNEYDFVAFVEDKVVVGDVTTSLSYEEIEDKKIKLVNFPDLDDVIVCRLVVQLGANEKKPRSSEEKDVKIVRVTSFDDNEFKDEFYRALSV